LNSENLSKINPLVTLNNVGLSNYWTNGALDYRANRLLGSRMTELGLWLTD